MRKGVPASFREVMYFVILRKNVFILQKMEIKNKTKR